MCSMVFLYGNNNPESNGFFPSCPFHKYTGLDCPGCGSQRAAHHLLNGHIGEAFAFNPLMVSAIPYLIIGFTFEFKPRLKQRYPVVRKTLFGPIAIKIWLVGVIAFWVARNFL